MPKLMLDLDGVITDSFFKGLYLDLWCHNLVKEDYDTFWKESVWRYNPTAQEFFKNIPHIYFYRPPSKETVETINLLAKEYEIYYITARPKFLEYQTKKYLDTYKLPFTDNLYFSENKVSEIKAFDIDWVVEDNLSLCDKLMGICGIILIRQLWNSEGWNRHVTVGYFEQLKELLL